jgi:hypothetical protein
MATYLIRVKAWDHRTDVVLDLTEGQASVIQAVCRHIQARAVSEVAPTMEFSSVNTHLHGSVS